MTILLRLAGLAAVIVGIALVSIPASLIIGGLLAIFISPMRMPPASQPRQSSTNPPCAPVDREPAPSPAPSRADAPTSRSRALHQQE